MRTTILASIWLLLFGVAWSANPPAREYSGMVQMSSQPYTYLVVHDTKTGKEPPWVARTGVLTISEAGEPSFQPLNISDWGEGEELPNDLESCCAVPGRPDEYLLAESGYYQGRFGRIFRVRISRLPGSALYYGEVLGRFRAVDRPAGDFSTASPDQFEGMTCFLNSSGELILVLGTRGGKGHQAVLLWGRLDLDGMRFERLGEHKLETDDPENLIRGCGDLHLYGQNPPVLLSVATRDPGDLGPFHSFIFQAGSFSETAGELRFQPAPFKPMWTLHGLKVEALSECGVPGSNLCVGTDDEVYGGIWRPLPVTGR